MKLNYFRYPPLSWEVNGKVRGILVDVLNEALQNRMGIKVTHHEFPWKRAQLMVRYGNADRFTTAPTPERREYTDVSN
jgi:polar amino acid transport system substrate-binding protein